uniref:Uncharacterized protein n=1 Tax=Lepeophtheirus salmonis TaxID=72036 RepID=A0A0K2UEB8_LEPSM
MDFLMIQTVRMKMPTFLHPSWY